MQAFKEKHEAFLALEKIVTKEEFNLKKIEFENSLTPEETKLLEEINNVPKFIYDRNEKLRLLLIQSQKNNMKSKETPIKKVSKSTPESCSNTKKLKAVFVQLYGKRKYFQNRKH